MKVRNIRLLAVVMAVGVGLWLWFGGVLGRMLVRCLPHLLPFWVAQDVVITRFSTHGVEEDDQIGVRLTISSNRLRECLKKAWLAAQFFPPGTIRSGWVIAGTWRPERAVGPDAMGLPLMLVVDDRVGDQPVLSCRYDADAFNALIRRHYEPRTRRKKRWVLGSYHQSHQIAFSSLHIFSDDDRPSLPVRERRLKFVATGVVRFEFDDGWARANVKASVGELRGNVVVRFEERRDGLALSYETDVGGLDANVKKVPPWGDRKISKDLETSVEKALNRPAAKGDMAKILLPRWVPLDTAVDIRLVPGATP